MAKLCEHGTETKRDKFGRCVVCRNARNRQYNKTDQKRTLSREAMQRWRAKDPAYALWYGAQRRAKKNELEFDTTPSDILVPDVCPLLGIELISGGSRETLDHAPALDRMENHRGYVRGNIWVISHRANSAKRDLSIAEFCRMADVLRDLECASYSIWRPVAGLTLSAPAQGATQPTRLPELPWLSGTSTGL